MAKPVVMRRKSQAPAPPPQQQAPPPHPQYQPAPPDPALGAMIDDLRRRVEILEAEREELARQRALLEAQVAALTKAAADKDKEGDAQVGSQKSRTLNRLKFQRQGAKQALPRSKEIIVQFTTLPGSTPSPTDTNRSNPCAPTRARRPTCSRPPPTPSRTRYRASMRSTASWRNRATGRARVHSDTTAVWLLARI